LRHIEEIQILRAFAALAIVIHHGIFECVNVAALAGTSLMPPRILPWPAGVDLFFVISGFVMVLSSQRLYGKPGAPRVFLWRRIARIVPIYWATTALVLAIGRLLPGAISGAEPDLAQTLAAFAFVPVPRADGLTQPVYSLGWTLNYEMFFYLVFALFLPLARNRAVAGVTIALGVLTAFGLLAEPANPALAFWSRPIVLLFVAGMGIAVMRLEGVALPAWLRLALALLGLAELALDPFGLMRNPLDIEQATNVTRVAAWGVPAVLFVAAVALRRADQPAPASAAPLWRLLVALGEASYALYLLHPFVFRPVREVLMRLNLVSHISPWPYLALLVIAACGAALLVHWLAERRVTAYLQAKFA
jgi:peptidoglycan/LPS O-acetylase OafA/YrhL